MFVVWYRKRRKLRKKDRLITEHREMDAFDKEGSEKSSLMRCEEKYNAKEDSKDVTVLSPSGDLLTLLCKHVIHCNALPLHLALPEVWTNDFYKFMPCYCMQF